MPIYNVEADGFRMIHLGYGDVMIGIGNDVDDGHLELDFIPVDVPGVIGKHTDTLEGHITTELKPGVRLRIDNEESAAVLVERLFTFLSRRFPVRCDPDDDSDQEASEGLDD